MTIAKRLTLLISISVLALVLLGGGSIYGLKQLDSKLEDINTNILPSVVLLNEITQNMFRIRLRLQSHLMSDDMDKQKVFETEIAGFHTKVMEQLDRYEKEMVENPKDGELLDLQSTLTAGGKKVLDAATELANSDPVGAFFDAERLPTAYRGTPVDKPATALLNKLRGNVKVERELRARTALNQVFKLDTQLAGKDMSFDPRLPEFKEDNAPLLKQLADGIERVRKTYPGSRAADEAARLADLWDVKVK